MYKKIAQTLPQSYVKSLRQRLEKAGVEINYHEWIGFFFMYSLIFSASTVLIAFILGFREILQLIVMGVGALTVFQVSSHVLLALAVDRKKTFVEKSLPEALSIISSNIRAGVSTEKAIFLSAKEEFGSFSKDIKNSSKKALFGFTTEDSLKELSKNASSNSVKRAFQLIIEGIRGGSKMSSLLDGISQDLRATKELENKMKASVSSYIMLFLIANSFGAPFLFALSGFLVESMSSFKQVSAVPSTNVQGLSINPSSNTIPIEHIKIISVISLVLNSVFTSLIIGEIEGQRAVRGVKFIIPLSAVSLIVYFLAGVFAQTLFTNMFV